MSPIRILVVSACAALAAAGPRMSSSPAPAGGAPAQDVIPAAARNAVEVRVPIASPSAVHGGFEARPLGDDLAAMRLSDGAGWLEYAVDVPVAGRYRVGMELFAPTAAPVAAVVWLEDHVDNADGRTYDVTGPRRVQVGAEPRLVEVWGSPLDEGTHRMRLHLEGAGVAVSRLRFDLLRPHPRSPEPLVQSTEGEEWALVWSDEFEGDGLPDGAKWTHDVGDWGWGNREPQLYTERRLENARREGGVLVIEARRDDAGFPWTSARLTTRGKASFLYGRFEIRARVPAADGTWAAGWLLGDAYRDERSWPYCGEIDVCEAVGREIDDETGDGLNHASCHTRAYYFKQGNHISSQLPVARMSAEFHVYALEWEPDEIRMYVDDQHYYTYDKTGDRLRWPFDAPQNLILNLAMGGGMGGPIDPELTSARFEVDYVRVYGRR